MHHISINTASTSIWSDLPTKPVQGFIFSSIRPGPLDISVQTDKYFIKTISNGSCNYNPVISPDDKWMVYVSEVEDTPALYVLELIPGAEPRKLFVLGGMQDAPVFSKDGRKLYFVSSHEDQAEIYEADFMPYSTLQKSDIRKMTEGGGNFSPVISPDGTKMLFVSNRGGKHLDSFLPNVPDNYMAGNLYLLDLILGGEPVRLTTEDAWHSAPFWSPSGTHVYYHSVVSGYARIYMKALNGFEPARVITPEGIEARNGVFKAGSSELFFIGKRLSKKTDGSDQWDTLDAKDRPYEILYLDQDESIGIALKIGQNIIQACMGTVYKAIVKDSDRAYPDFGEGTAPNSREIASKGPFLISKTLVSTPKGNFLAVLKVRGYFPVYNSDETVTCYEDFGRVVKVELKPPFNITPLFKPNGLGFSLVASRDGNKFATSVGMPFGGNKMACSIWTFNRDGSDAKNVTIHLEGASRHPAFGPDGSLFFSHGKANELDRHIWVINPEGHVRQLTSGYGNVDVMPSVSPDGNKLVYSSRQVDSHFELFMMTLDKQQNPSPRKIQLTHSKSPNLHASFIDNETLVFSSKRNGLNRPLFTFPHFYPQADGEVYRMSLSDRSIVRETNDPYENSLPSGFVMGMMNASI